jgi:hypothetical protein
MENIGIMMADANMDMLQKAKKATEMIRTNDKLKKMNKALDDPDLSDDSNDVIKSRSKRAKKEKKIKIK